MGATFVGFLDTYEVRGEDVELRFVSERFDPLPTEPPVLCVHVRNAQNLADTQAALERVHSLGDYTFVEQLSPTEVTVHADYEEPLCIRGELVALRAEQYDPRDFECLAKINHQWGQSQYSSLTKALLKIHESESLIVEQSRRLEIKMQHYKLGSPARTLCKQHLSFLARILAIIKA